MALADYVKKNNANLDKFTFDTKHCTPAKLKEIANDSYIVNAMFYGKTKNGKDYATIYIKDLYFFVPDFKVTQVTEMCKDNEVRKAINEQKLAVSIYEYENDFGIHKSISFTEAD